MSQHLANRYASVLSTEDAIYLFKKLCTLYGGVAGASRAVGLSRKAPYNWGILVRDETGPGDQSVDKTKIDIKYKNKVKILQQLLEKSSLDTFEYLSERLTHYSSEIVMSYIEAMYENTVMVKDKKSFESRADLLLLKLFNYIGLIGTRHNYEINDMLTHLTLYAKSLNSTWRTNPIHVYDSQQVENIISGLLDAFISPESVNLDDLSLRLKIPEAAVNKAKYIIENQHYSKPRNERRMDIDTAAALSILTFLYWKSKDYAPDPQVQELSIYPRQAIQHPRPQTASTPYLQMRR